MEIEDSKGIYGLITSLCEKLSRDPSKVKDSRTKCYEILLKKTIPKVTRKYKNLSIDNPICNLMAWQYALWDYYKLPQCAQQMLEYHDFLQESYEKSGYLDNYNNILKFLLHIRDVPQTLDDGINLSLLPQWGFDYGLDKLFKLPKSMLCEPTDWTKTLFYFKPKEKQSNFNGLQKENLSDKSDDCVSLDKENERNCLIEEESIDIWEIAAKEKYNDMKNWENYGYSEPDKEPIFLSELGDLSSLWIDNLQSVYLPKIIKNGIVYKPEVKCKRKFIRDLKYLLVGIASESFTYNDFGELILIPDITLEGITEETLEIFVKDFTFSGTCYKSLKKISYQNPYTNKHKRTGYIFEEFCESLNKYLQFYTTAIMSIPDDINLLEFNEKTNHLKDQIITLTSICRVGPYEENEEIPHGVDLLNYLYEKIAQIVDRKTILVLYSILYPCCQIYFGRFISQWILDGSIHDPYGEFFIKTDPKFIKTRGRTHWTRSFQLCTDIIPDFLQDLKDDILLCGKMMNLLKLCHPFNELSIFLMGKKPQIISCCITRNQLIALEQNAQTYHIEASEVCGPKMSLEFLLHKENELNGDLLNLISKKRAATLKRIELERQKIAQELYEKKLEERTMLKEQYDIALQHKQLNMLQDIENEIKLIESNIRIEEKNEKLLKDEAKDLIEYYEKLFEISDAKREKIEKSIEMSKNYHLDSNLKQIYSLKKENLKDIEKNENSKEVEENVSEIEGISEISVEETLMPVENEKIPNIVSSEDVSINSLVSSKSLDELNANCSESQDLKENNNNSKAELISKNDNFKSTLDNFEQAKRNKMKVLNEMGITSAVPMKKSEIFPKNLTEAQRNKLKVMSSEFDIEMKPLIRERIDKKITISDINKYKMMNSTIFFDSDNNANSIQTEKKIEENRIDKKSLSLNFENFEKSAPMSVDSTPLSDNASTISTVTSKINFDEKIPTTACTEITDDGGSGNFAFKFDENQLTSIKGQEFHFSKRFPSDDVKNIEPMCLKMFLSESLSYSLKIQTNLVGNELLKYFVNNLNYLNHLKNLKNYFFLQDGEFGNNLTETLFNKLYNAKLPMDLLNFSVLSYLLHDALEDTKKSDHFNRLSFKINNLPEIFNLGDIDVLNCLSLTYKVEWPLNILLPCDTLAKYNDVFKFLLKINRINWVLKKIFWNLRIFSKQTGKKEQYLNMSIHFRKIQQFRYFMMHFVQTFQNYITEEVLQTQWVVFEKKLCDAGEHRKNLDEIYDAHTQYIKNILFMCLLNQRSAPLKKVFDRIFTVILKFYDHLRSRKWRCENGTFIHPNFEKLQTIFDNFKELVDYLFKIGRKVVENGYQPQFKYFLDTLNSNNFYLK